MFAFISLPDNVKFKPGIKPDFFNEVFLWTCHDECGYHCMWRTTNAFVSRDWAVPQFYGKWPFKRILGIQEPASVFFSFLNLFAHWRMIRKFRREVRNDSPLYYVWHVFSAVRLLSGTIICLQKAGEEVCNHFWMFVITPMRISLWCCSNCGSLTTFYFHLDLHEWMDVFNHLSYSRLSADRIVGLWIRLFHGFGQFQLHNHEVNYWRDKEKLHILMFDFY